MKPAPPRSRDRSLHNALVVAKKSVYEIYFVKRLADGVPNPSRPDPRLLKAFRRSHDVHYGALVTVQKTLDRMGLRHCTIDRKRDIPRGLYDLVVTVGGDGTFLSAAAQTADELMLGINSNPEISVGRFCSVTEKEFAAVLRSALEGTAPIRKLHRMDLWMNGKFTGIRALNDLLVCHISPPAMSHYKLTVGRRTEDQHSSGVWIATAAGSTGALQSAGGRPLPLGSNHLEYRPRELYIKHKRGYRLKGGIVKPGTRFVFHSMMEDGRIFVDGTRAQLSFCHGDVLEVCVSAHPLRVIDSGRQLEARNLRRS